MIWSAIIGQLIEFAPYLIGFMGLFGVGWKAVSAIKSSERRKIKLENADEYQRTIKEMGRVEVSDDHDSAQQWLRERGKL